MSATAAVLGTLRAVAAVLGFAPAQNNPNHEKVGQHFSISAASLPAPYTTPASSENSRRDVRPDPAKLLLPPGFHANIFAAGGNSLRWLQVAPNGDVFVAQTAIGKISLLRDEKGGGSATMGRTFAEGFKNPHGMAISNGKFYVADTDGIYSFPYKDGDTKAGAKAQVTAPKVFGAPGAHWTRNLAIDSKGDLYVAVGSAENIADTDPAFRAAIDKVENGKLAPFATGLRNPVGIAFYPGTNDLYTVVNERDGEGDELVPDYFTRVQQGDFFGWPYAYIGHHEEPSLNGKRADLVARAKVPDVLFRAHSAPLGLVFYTGTQFPAAYRGGAFVAHHGSWNAAQPRGYKIVYIPFANGRPSGGYNNFALGFWQDGTAPAGVMGRPVGLAQAKDGSLLVADDVANIIWRISYTGK